VSAAPAAVREKHYSGRPSRDDQVAIHHHPIRGDAHVLGKITAHESSLPFAHPEISVSRVERRGFDRFTGPMGRLPTPSVGLLLTVLILGVATLVVNGEDIGRSGSAAASPAVAPSATRTAGPQTSPRRSAAPPNSSTRKVRQSERGPTQASPAPRPHQGKKSASSPARGNHRSGSGEAPIKRGGVVYLTFDDGPGPYTPAILNILRATHSTATFFELGFRQAQYPAEAARIRAQGSNVGNHTYNHPNLTKLTPGQIQWQVAHGPHSRCLRPPYGATNATVQRILSERGLRQVLWTVDTRDWSRPGITHIVKTATGPEVRAGTIILMHDGGGNRSQTVAALPQIITTLQHQGYSIRCIPGC
jgi:peptidoglycan-N-acetylglucosamine deacetylase